MRKIKWKIGSFMFFLIIILTVALLQSDYSGAENNIQEPTVKRGATVIVVPGVTRHWKDADKTPLDELSGPRKLKPVLNFKLPRKIVRPSTEPDPVVQDSYASSEASRTPFMPTPTMNFAGMTLSANGAGWPPDTTGDVGPTYYVQAVNTSIGIYNKSTGALVSATTYDSFFAGAGITGTPCDDENNGDPLVLYDAYAQRWFILDFAWAPSETDGSYYSIAVSKTSDPTGAWWMYALRADATLLNDYPKAGIWHDGIYVTANMFTFAGVFQGVRVWAIKKQDIYNGTLIAQTVYDNSWYAWSLLPSNAKGANPPPASAPNYMYGYDADEWGYSANDTLAVFKYDVDWTTPANTTWTGPTLVTTAPFSLHDTEIPQLGTSRTLDTLGSRLMFAAMYQNHSSYESVYLSHLVDVGGAGAMRWYEVRLSGGTSSIYQQGTYAPDTNHRWMGSICGDSSGNIAMGYSVSSSSMYPAIRYAGRLSADPVNLLAQGEASMIEGTGSQTTYNRWGDYSTMTIDPVDNETFWYTQEYYTGIGLNWQTRIGSFKMASSTQLPVFDGSDFSGGGSADVAVWRPSDGNWYIRSVGTIQWGTSGDTPVNGNFDTSAASEIAVWRSSNGYWFIRGIGNYQWGTSGDVPVPGDYNGDNTTDIAVWRPSNGYWFIRGIGNYQWGASGDIMVPGDYNGDGTDEIAVWRPSNGYWFIRGIGNYQWGTSGDIPVPGDYDGDGSTDIAVWRPSNGYWFIQYSGGGVGVIQWGSSGDTPVPGNYNGDSTTDIAVWRPTLGNWYVYGQFVVQWGANSDVPLVR